MNFTFIRLIVAEYSAAAEELSHLMPSLVDAPPRTSDLLEASVPSADTYQLTIPFINSALAAFNITLDQLRLFAVSIIPYGSDEATMQIMKLETKYGPNSALGIPNILNNIPMRLQWYKRKNDIAHLEEVVKGICEREEELKPVDFVKDLDKKLAFDWCPPFLNRLWIAYEN